MPKESDGGITIKTIEHNPGLLVEKLNPLATSSTTWKMIQRINLESFFSRWNHLLGSWSILEAFCIQEKASCPYRQQLNQTRQQIEDTMRNADKVGKLLQGHETTQKPRVKRAWISIIGKISRTLFGTLDEEAGEEIKQIINIAANDTR